MVLLIKKKKNQSREENIPSLEARNSISVQFYKHSGFKNNHVNYTPQPRIAQSAKELAPPLQERYCKGWVKDET